MNEVMRVLKQFDCKVGKPEIQLFCSLDVGIPKNREGDVLYKINELRDIEILKV